MTTTGSRAATPSRRPLITTRLMGHQRDAVAMLTKHDGVLMLAMDPGTGKTLTAWSYIAADWARSGAKPVDWLIVTPTAALYVWEEEAAKHLHPDVPVHIEVLDQPTTQERLDRLSAIAASRPTGIRVTVLNHRAFATSAPARTPTGRKRRKRWGTYKKGKKRGQPIYRTVKLADILTDTIKQWSPHGLVLDESHRAKNVDANTTKRLIDVAPTFRRRILATGTIAPRTPLDAFGQYRILDPTIFGIDYDAFEDRYAQRGGWNNLSVVGVRPDREHELWAKVHQRAAIAKKSECLDLPPLRHVCVPVKLTQPEADAYTSMARRLIAHLHNGGKVSARSHLGGYAKLRQITGGTVRTPTGVTEIGDAKLRACTSLVEDLTAAEEKVVIFGHFTADCSRIVNALTNTLGDDARVLPIGGSTPPHVRQSRLDRFQSHKGPAVLVAQQRAVGIGINKLTVAANAIFFSYSERRDDVDQALDRLHRLGQTRPVTVYHLQVRGTVDQVMWEGHRVKKHLEDLLTSNTSAWATPR